MDEVGVARMAYKCRGDGKDPAVRRGQNGCEGGDAAMEDVSLLHHGRSYLHPVGSQKALRVVGGLHVVLSFALMVKTRGQLLRLQAHHLTVVVMMDSYCHHGEHNGQ